MEFKVRLFLEDRPLLPGDYGQVIIANPTIDRIVNDIYDKSTQIQTSDTNSTSEEDNI